MLYEHDNKLYLKTCSGFQEVVATMTNGCPEVIPYGATISKRPYGAKATTLQEIVARHHLTEGVTYPSKAKQGTPSVAPQSGEGRSAQPTTPVGVKPKK